MEQFEQSRTKINDKQYVSNRTKHYANSDKVLHRNLHASSIPQLVEIGNRKQNQNNTPDYTRTKNAREWLD